MINQLKSSLWKQFNSILVVDDDPVLLSFLKEILVEEGFEVITCKNAVEALKTLTANSFSVAIIDINMPDLSGIEILKELKKSKSLTKVIINTGYQSIDTAKQALNLGAFAYVEKLDEPEALLNHVLMALREQLYESAKEVKLEKDQSLLDKNEYADLEEAVLENASDGVLLEQNGKCLYVNVRLCKILGLSKTELLGKPFHSILPIDKMSKKNDKKIYEGPVLCKSGKIKNILIEASSIQFKDIPSQIFIVKDLSLLDPYVIKFKELGEENVWLKTRLKEDQDFVFKYLNQLMEENPLFKKPEIKTLLEPIFSYFDLDSHDVQFETIFLEKMAEEVINSIRISPKPTIKIEAAIDNGLPLHSDKTLFTQLLSHFIQETSKIAKKPPKIYAQTSTKEKNILLHLKASPLNINLQKEMNTPGFFYIKKILSLLKYYHTWSSKNEEFILEIQIDHPHPQ